MLITFKTLNKPVEIWVCRYDCQTASEISAFLAKVRSTSLHKIKFTTFTISLFPRILSLQITYLKHLWIEEMVRHTQHWNEIHITLIGGKRLEWIGATAWYAVALPSELPCRPVLCTSLLYLLYIPVPQATLQYSYSFMA